MQLKRYLAASIGVFVFVFVFEWLFHGGLLKPIYDSTAHLWRTQADYNAHMGWLFGGQLFFSFIFTYIFIQNFQNKGLGEGVRFGLLIGLFFVPMNMIKFAVTPYLPNLVALWIVGGMVECVISGIVAAAIFKQH